MGKSSFMAVRMRRLSLARHWGNSQLGITNGGRVYRPVTDLRGNANSTGSRISAKDKKSVSLLVPFVARYHVHQHVELAQVRAGAVACFVVRPAPHHLSLGAAPGDGGFVAHLAVGRKRPAVFAPLLNERLDAATGIDWHFTAKAQR